MLEQAATDNPIYLTTKEVADLLRVKERKVYDLAAAGEIPHRRITGKLLFPKSELVSWIEGGAAAAPTDRPAVLTGSHDPLLDWAVRESGSGLATLLNGSFDGLEVFAKGDAALSGLHIADASGWNVQTLGDLEVRDCVLIGWARRARGLILADHIHDQVSCFADLRGKRVVMRQPGAGAAALFQDLMAKDGLTKGDFVASEGLAHTESDAAAAIAAGEADASIGIEAMARRFHLRFLPLVEECFDLVIDRRAYFTQPVQQLLDFAQGDALREKAAAMGGYDLAMLGSVRWLSP